MTTERKLKLKIGRLIAKERKAKGFTSFEFSKLLSISPPTMSAIERGHASNIDNYLLALRLLGLDEGLNEMVA
jgi:transcriptional regulator with XRE-family HTH domain